MMSVKEYALDINRTIEEVLDKCKELNIKVITDEEMLTEENVIDLDNAFDKMIEEEFGTELTEIKNNNKKRISKKVSEKRNEDFLKKRKKMYKSKEKLTTNIPSYDESIVLYKEGMTVNELGTVLKVNAVELIKKLMDLGVMANINTSLSFDNAELLVVDYDKTLKKEETQDEVNFEKLEIIDQEEDLISRPPIVTIMGHVDHGKTTLLDKIRETKVVKGEAGGITQHIGAYQVEWNNKKITFIDTPGHAAFTEMRVRGAKVTDIVIIVVAVDDGVMPQTKEAIDHAKAAKAPIIVALNKMDKENIDPDKIMSELTEYGLTPEEWGGDTIYVKISALTGEGIDKLLETILLVAEMEDLKANNNRYALGTVIEAKLDKNQGPVVTLIIENGTLRLGDPIVIGTTFGKVRTLKNDHHKEITKALPAMPVEVTGLNETPTAGDKFMSFETEKKARSIAISRKTKIKQTLEKDSLAVSLDDLFDKIKKGSKEINVVLKTDVKGSEEALKKALEELKIEDVKINIIRRGTGAITESDIVLANASAALIIGFNIRPDSKILELAKEYRVDIRIYNVIYKVLEELEAAMKGLLEPIYEEKILGRAEVRKLFKFSKVGIIAGCYVVDGLIKNTTPGRIIRDGILIYDGKIKSLQREKEIVKEVKQGYECGITIEDFNDIKEKDIIEAYEKIEKQR
jgi:translation initiation factor IF-2